MAQTPSRTDSSEIHSLWVGPISRNEKWAFFSLSFPVYFNLIGLTSDPAAIQFEGSGIAAYGSSEFAAIHPNNKLPPGDYSLGVAFNSEAAAKSINGMVVTVRCEVISNLLIYQMLARICRNEGYEPSQLLAQPTRSKASATPIYRKVRSDLDNLQKAILEKLESTPDKSVTVDITEVTQLKKDYDVLYKKLQEAEDYIDTLSSQI